jgi:hypothetical protein
VASAQAWWWVRDVRRLSTWESYGLEMDRVYILTHLR